MTVGLDVVRTHVAKEVNTIQSEQHKEDLQTLCEAIGDSALATHVGLCVKHLQLMQLQLLAGCLTKIISGGLEAMLRDPVAFMEKARIVHEPIEQAQSVLDDHKDLVQLYDSAYGSSGTCAGLAMLKVFQDKALQSPLSPAAAHMLNEHLSAVNFAYTETLQRLSQKTPDCGVPTGGLNARLQTSQTVGKGCLLFIVSVVMACVILMSYLLTITTF